MAEDGCVLRALARSGIAMSKLEKMAVLPDELAERLHFTGMLLRQCGCPDLEAEGRNYLVEAPRVLQWTGNRHPADTRGLENGKFGPLGKEGEQFWLEATADGTGWLLRSEHAVYYSTAKCWLDKAVLEKFCEKKEPVVYCAFAERRTNVPGKGDTDGLFVKLGYHNMALEDRNSAGERVPRWRRLPNSIFVLTPS